MLMTVLRGVRVDGHTADRVDHTLRRSMIVMVKRSLGHDSPT
jgi:hypothetical protein